MIKRILIAEATDNALTTSQLLARYDALCKEHNVCVNCTHHNCWLYTCTNKDALKNQLVPSGFGCNHFQRISS